MNISTNVSKLIPLLPVLHEHLHFVDTLEALQALVQQIRGVVDGHVYKTNELLSSTLQMMKSVFEMCLMIIRD